jgi:hypothetical protein
MNHHQSKLETELTRIRRSQISVNNTPMNWNQTEHQRKTLRRLEKREHEILSELAAIKEAA